MTNFAPVRVSHGILEVGVVMGSDGGYTVEQDPALVGDLPMDSPIIQDVGTPFTLAGFNARRTPIIVGDGDLTAVPVGTNINSLPIKFPNTDYRVPSELRGIEPILKTCVSVESIINQESDACYAYLSLQRTHVQPGQFQRSAEVHCDGLQGPRIQPKVSIEHGYVMVDRDPTTFFPEPLDLTDLDVDVHDIGKAFEQRVNRKISVALPLGSLALIDGYCLHEAMRANEAGIRGFFRVLFSPRQYDRIGNSVNTLFMDEYRATGWKYEPRPRPILILP